jgi:hypothetical protein
MPYRIQRDKNGQIKAIACGSCLRRACSTPGCSNEATLLCDFMLPNGKTCDRPICPRCAGRIGPNRDYCGPHARTTTIAKKEG